MVWPLQDSLNAQSSPTAQPLAPWTDASIRDTIAAIARQTDYQRELGQSALNRILRWLWDRFVEFLETLRGLPHGREIAFVLLIVVVLLVIARIVIGVRAQENVNRVVARGQVAAGRHVSLAEAERLAGAGNFTAAAHVLFSALLMAGAARGEFRVHPSKTTGDYVRDLRRKRAPWLSPFQSFRSRYDRVMYGDMLCTAEDYGALLSDARNMLARERAA